MPELNRLVFKRRALSIAIGSFFTLCVLLELGAIASGPGKGGLGVQVFAGVLAALSIVGGYRGWRMGTLVADDRQVIIRGFIRTRRVPLAMVRGAEAVTKSNMYGLTGKSPALITVDGSPIVAGEFWTQADSHGQAREAESISQQLRDWIAARQPGDSRPA